MRTLLPIVLIIASIGLFVMYINPTYAQIGGLNAQLQQYDVALNQSAQIRQVRGTLLARRNTFSTSDVDRIERLLPDNIDNIRLIIDINDIAARYHLQLANVAVSSQAASSAGSVGGGGGPLGTVNLSFTVGATYDNFVAFLQDLQRSLRLIDITHIKFNTADTDPSARGALKYDIQLQTYWLRQNSMSPSASQ